jgi:hypothetical protein
MDYKETNFSSELQRFEKEKATKFGGFFFCSSSWT